MFFCVIETVESLNTNFTNSWLLDNFIKSFIKKIGNILRNRIFDVFNKSSVLNLLFILSGIELGYGSDLLGGEKNTHFITKKVEEMGS